MLKVDKPQRSDAARERFLSGKAGLYHENMVKNVQIDAKKVIGVDAGKFSVQSNERALWANDFRVQDAPVRPAASLALVMPC